MRNLFYFFLLLAASALYSASIQAQLVNGCGFLQQNRLEIGIANNGAYGTPEDAPVGYHPNNTPLFATTYNPATGTYIQRVNALGFVADYDSNGWNVGVPPYMGDYFLPGTPQEGWSIEYDGVRCDAFSSTYQTSGTTGFVGTLTGTNQYVTNTGSLSTSMWMGDYGALHIKQTTSMKVNKLYFTANVKFYNTGTTVMHNLYYMRTLDPDNDVSTTGNFSTINNITYQLPNPANKSLVGCTSTTNPNAYLGLGTIDCRSKVFICNLNLFPPTDTLGWLFSGMSPDLTYTGTLTSDVGVGIIYQLGNLAPGDSTELNFAYILNEASLDEALNEIKPKWLNNSNLYQTGDTIYACANTSVPVSIINGDALNWTWSANAPMGNTTGTTNTISFGTTPVTVTAIGTGICFDTITFHLLSTAMFFTTINASICSGNAYVFNGVSYQTAGTYHDTVSTASGCDSIVTLNLAVGANSTHTLNVSVCQGSAYPFNGNLLTVAGTYFDTLVNAVGCDSLIVLHLTTGNTTFGTVNASVCNGSTYNFFGVLLSTAGTYTDTTVNVSGCDSVVTLHLTVKPMPVPDFTIDKSQICNSDSVLITYTGSTNPSNIYVFNPAGGSILSGSGKGPYRVKWSTSGIKYPSFVVTLNGCSSQPVSKAVTVVDGPHVKLDYDSNVCLDGTGKMQATVDVAGCVYNWNLFGATLVSGSTSGGGPLVLAWNTTGPQWVTLQCDNLGCLSNLDSALIQVRPLPTAHISSLDGTDHYCETDIAHLTSDFISDGTYFWQPLGMFVHYGFNTADLQVYDTTEVSVRVMTSYGCLATDSMTIYSENCEQYFIPNVFTPNGDQLNDVFHVVGLRTNAHIDMSIYDRWGNLVHHSDNGTGWDGYYDGKPAETGVYFYYIRLTFPTGVTKTLKGDVTLLR